MNVIERISGRDRWTGVRLKLAKYLGKGGILEEWEEVLQNVRDLDLWRSGRLYRTEWSDGKEW